jgi:hypothetical protein
MLFRIVCKIWVMMIAVAVPVKVLKTLAVGVLVLMLPLPSPFAALMSPLTIYITLIRGLFPQIRCLTPLSFYGSYSAFSILNSRTSGGLS